MQARVYYVCRAHVLAAATKKNYTPKAARCYEAKCLNKSTAVPTPLVVNDVFIYYLL